MSQIVIIGSLNMDLVVRVAQMPAPGETVPGSDLQTICGGKGANQAVAAGRIAGSAAMIGRVGNDAFGQRLLESLRQANVQTEHVRQDNDTVTGTAVIVVDARGENSIVISAGANGHVTSADVDLATPLLRNASLVLLQHEIPPETIEYAIDLCPSLSCRVILNPAPIRAVKPETLSHVDFLIPNEIEAEKMSGISIRDGNSASKAARQLRHMGAGVVVITMGDKGALLSHAEGDLLIPAPSVTAVDTTAAGDAFIGGFAAALARGLDLPQAVAYANCAGGLAVTRFGAQTSIPFGREVDELYKTFYQKVLSKTSHNI